MRLILCRNQCQRPPGVPFDSSTVYSSSIRDCELSIGLPNGREVFAYRHTPVTEDVQISDCWNGFDRIFVQCIEQGSAVGWMNDPDFEFFKMGIRANNDPEALHDQDFYGENNHLDVAPSFG
jgi:hypothetical protein